jgi:hypothetical protein
MGYQATISGSSLLEETFSIQPLAVALPENQSRLKDAVNWIVQAPAAATELGISSRDLPGLIAQAERGGALRRPYAPHLECMAPGANASSFASPFHTPACEDTTTPGANLGGFVLYVQIAG